MRKLTDNRCALKYRLIWLSALLVYLCGSCLGPVLARGTDAQDDSAADADQALNTLMQDSGAKDKSSSAPSDKAAIEKAAGKSPGPEGQKSEKIEKIEKIEKEHSSSKEELAKRILDPTQFFGSAQAAYTAAKQVPDVLIHLFCYCGCDRTDGHKSTLDCFSSDHAEDCPECCNSAIQALLMTKQGKSIADIQQWVDQKYEKEYIFEKPSPALLEYRAHRLYKPVKADAQSTLAASQPPKLKPGAVPSKCCQHDK